MVESKRDKLSDNQEDNQNVNVINFRINVHLQSKLL